MGVFLDPLLTFPFGICDIYFDLKVYRYYFIIHYKDPYEPTSKMECHKGFDHFSGRGFFHFVWDTFGQIIAIIHCRLVTPYMVV